MGRQDMSWMLKYNKEMIRRLSYQLLFLYCFSFGSGEHVDLSTKAVCLDPVYDVLWR